MRQFLMAVSLVTAGILGTSFLVSHIQGPTPAAAASKHGTSRTNARANATRTAGNTSPHADGKVTAVNGNTITVQADNDLAGSTEYTKVSTIVLTNATTYKGPTTKASIVKGVTIIAEGTVSSDGTTLTATSVGVGGHGGPGGGHGGPHADGTVTGMNGNTVSVKPDSDDANSTEYTKVTTVVLTGTTTYGPATTKAAIAAGVNFVAEGTLSPDGQTLTATRFSIRGSGAHAGSNVRHP